MVTTTMSPAAAASAGVATRACGPSCATRSVRVSGPRLLLRTTSWPASTASRATVPPMCPLPMSPMVVMAGPSTPAARSFPEPRAEPFRMRGQVVVQLGRAVELDGEVDLVERPCRGQCGPQVRRDVRPGAVGRVPTPEGVDEAISARSTAQGGDADGEVLGVEAPHDVLEVDRHESS